MHERFGRPVRMVKEPEYVWTDDGFGLAGGEFEEIDAPDWWFKWELTDEDSAMNYMSGDEVGKDEVGFIATQWLLLPLARSCGLDAE